MITEERMASYLFSLEQESPEAVRRIEEEALKAFVPIIKRPTQSLLRFLIESRRPGQVLEVGCAVGFSSIFMSQYLNEDGRITTIEKIPKRIIKARENIAAAGKEAVITLLEGEASDILSELAQKRAASFDFIFMDAAKGQYLSFLPSVFSLLKPGGLLVSDNVLQEGSILESRYAITRRDRTIHERMRQYLYRLSHDEGLITVVLPVGDGVALSIKREDVEYGKEKA